MLGMLEGGEFVQKLQRELDATLLALAESAGPRARRPATSPSSSP